MDSASSAPLEDSSYTAKPSYLHSWQRMTCKLISSERESGANSMLLKIFSEFLSAHCGHWKLINDSKKDQKCISSLYLCEKSTLIIEYIGRYHRSELVLCFTQDWPEKISGGYLLNKLKDEGTSGITLRLQWYPRRQTVFAIFGDYPITSIKFTSHNYTRFSTATIDTHNLFFPFTVTNLDYNRS